MVWANSPWMPRTVLRWATNESGEVFGEMAPLALVGEEVPELIEGVLNDRGEFDNGWHDQMLR